MFILPISVVMRQTVACEAMLVTEQFTEFVILPGVTRQKSPIVFQDSSRFCKVIIFLKEFFKTPQIINIFLYLQTLMNIRSRCLPKVIHLPVWRAQCLRRETAPFNSSCWCQIKRNICINMERERTVSFRSVPMHFSSMNVCQASAICQTPLEATEELILCLTLQRVGEQKLNMQ